MFARSRDSGFWEATRTKHGTCPAKAGHMSHMSSSLWMSRQPRRRNHKKSMFSGDLQYATMVFVQLAQTLL